MMLISAASNPVKIAAKSQNVNCTMPEEMNDMAARVGISLL